jgi:hypothetical protein
MRVTKKELEAMFMRLERNLRRHGKISEGDRLALEHGSKTYGNSYRVVVLGDRRYEPFGTFHFGFTARDCYNRMHALCCALEYV